MSRDTAARWRLLLGRYAERRLAAELSAEQARMDRALDYLQRDFAENYPSPGGQRRQRGAGRSTADDKNLAR